MLTHICSFPGPPFPVLPSGLLPILPFTSKFTLRLSRSVSFFYPPRLLQTIQPKKKKKKCLNVREKQNTARRANESASWGRQTQATQGPRGLPGAVPTRTSPPPGGVDQRPPDGLRKCSCQESEASLWSSRLRQSLPGGRWRMPHLLIICARQDCLPTCPSTLPPAIRLRRAHHIAHVSHAACFFLFQAALHIVWMQKHSPTPAVRVDD